MKEMQAVKWTTEDDEELLEGYKLFGHNWVKVADFIATRSQIQVKAYVQ